MPRAKTPKTQDSPPPASDDTPTLVNPAAFARLFRAYLRRQLKKYAASDGRRAAVWETMAVSSTLVQLAVERVWREDLGASQPTTRELLKWLSAAGRWPLVWAVLSEVIPQVLNSEERSDAAVLSGTVPDAA